MYTWMKSVKNIRQSIQYPITDKEDQETRGERVEGAIFGGGLLDTGDAASLARQFEYYLHQAGRYYGKDINGNYRILGWKKTISFSAREIDPEDPEGADKALAIVEKVQANLAPDCLYLAIAQRDGKRHLWHVHIVQNAVHSSTLKAMTGRETNRDFFKEHVEEAAVDMGITLDSGKSHPKRKSQDSKSKKRHEHAKQTEGYSWMDDLQARIAQTVLRTTSYKDFEANLNANGVNVSRKTKSGWTYELAECQNEKYIGKKARYDKFSIDFSQSTLNKFFDKNYKEMVAKGLDPRTGERRLPDISSIQQTEGYGMERKDDE